VKWTSITSADKPGRLSTTVTDLVVPAPGVPISLIRARVPLLFRCARIGHPAASSSTRRTPRAAHFVAQPEIHDFAAIARRTRDPGAPARCPCSRRHARPRDPGDEQREPPRKLARFVRLGGEAVEGAHADK
jgi:hypothetical protein